MGTQLARRRLGVEVPVRLARQCGVRCKRQDEAFRRDDLCRPDAFERRRQLLERDFAQPEFAAGEVEPGEAGLQTRRAQGEQQHVALVVEQRGIGQRTRRDDARNGAFDRSLARRRIADLFADHDRFAEFHEASQVLLDRVIRNAGHLDRLSRALSACCQGDVEQACGLFRIFEEEFVEVAHAIEEQKAGVLCL